RRSALNRPKWDEHPAYLDRTIAAAINAAAQTKQGFGDPAERRFFPTLRDILSRPELMTKPEALVRLVAWPGRVTLLAGAEKRAGKSTFLAAAVGRLARGKPFLGLEPAGKPRGALWVSADEEHTADVVGRFMRLGAPKDHIAVLYPSGSL